MKTIATIKLKIPNNKIIIDSIKQYSNAITYISNQGIKHNISNRYKLHHLTYYKTKYKFNLPSQYVINAIRIASQTLKSVKTSKGGNPIYKEYMPLDFDRRTFTFTPNKIRITTTKERVDIPIEIPEYYKRYLDWKYQTARIIYDKKTNNMFIHITFSKDITINSNSDRFLGIDTGINNIAVTSNKQFFNSNKIKRIKNKFRYLRARLQSKGTKSSKRLLKKISRREKRFMRQCNHEISKAIVSSCNIGDTIVMENIKGIRKQNKGRRFNYWLNSWSFYQLRQFIEYKARLHGNKVILVDPRNTSKTCSRCLSLRTRRNSSDFHCFACDYHLNADLNASLNIRLLGRFLATKASVTEPYIPNDDFKAIGFSSIGTADEFRDKSSIL